MSELICKKCKTENKDNYKFCFQCGSALSENTTDEISEALLGEREVELLMKLSYVFEINNLVDEAIEAYSAITEVHPNWADVRFKLARAYEVKGLYGKAISEYKKAISANSNYVEASRCLGELYSDEGFYEEAIEEFNKVLETKITFNYADVNNYMGMALDKLGRSDEAIEKFKKAIQIHPEYGDALFNLAKVYNKKKVTDKAQEYITKAVTACPNNNKYRKLEEEIKQSIN